MIGPKWDVTSPRPWIVVLILGCCTLTLTIICAYLIPARRTMFFIEAAIEIFAIIVCAIRLRNTLRTER